MKYKTYPKMKDSGIEWVGEIPEEWLTPSVSKIYDIQLGKMLQPKPESDEDVLIPYLKAENVHWEHVKTKDLPKMWAKPFEIVKYGVKKGDLLVCEGGEGGRSAILSTNMGDVIIQNALHRIRSVKNANLQYLMYNLITCNVANWFDVINNKATIAHFTKEKFSSLKLLHPSKEEQKQITKFLDSQTSKIDSEIKKNEKLVTLLQEKKQATINHAVTKGLDDSVPMKDSGVEWIGEIPEEWSIGKLKHIGSLNAGGTPSRSKKEYWDNGTIPWLSSGEVNYGIITSSHEKITELGLVESSTTKNPRGTVLLAITGEGQTRGRSALLEIEATTNQSVIGIIQNKKNMYNYFLFFYLQSQYWNLRSNSHGSVQSGLNLEIVGNYPIGIPPKYEQEQITEFLDKQTKHIDELISKAKLQIKTLQEYRQSLISSAVTGKICVTN
jgi:type I restriction enzyme, S subunit